jgi:hypothetical protein
VKRFSVLLGAAMLAFAPVGAGEPARTYAERARVTYIANALAALAESPPDATREIAQYARSLARGACSSGAQRLRVECLVVASQRFCRDKAQPEARRCALVIDIVTSNVLADERLVPPATRYAIMRDNKDYRRALAHELRRAQGALVVDYRLHADRPEDPASIDRHCLAAADATSLPYPMCVSSLVWFMKGPP